MCENVGTKPVFERYDAIGAMRMPSFIGRTGLSVNRGLGMQDLRVMHTLSPEDGGATVIGAR